MNGAFFIYGVRSAKGLCHNVKINIRFFYWNPV